MTKSQGPARSPSADADALRTLRLEPATAADAAAVAALRNAAAEDLTTRFGHGFWSSDSTARGVLFDLRHSMVCVARLDEAIVATLRLATKKPWAIDKKYFSACEMPLYLTSMAVDPALQGRGIGRRCMDEVERIARAWPADAIRLDAYDADAGAPGFYLKCGFREVGRVTYRKIPLVYFERSLDTAPRGSIATL
jgi:ribosomal protein S18 acetylase RimI-like enzyme